MTQTIQAIYEDGVFKPLEPVDLPPSQAVQLTVEPAAKDTETVTRVREALAASGRLRTLSPELQRRIIPGVTLEEVRAALGRAGGKPLSELVIEQRGPRQ